MNKLKLIILMLCFVGCESKTKSDYITANDTQRIIINGNSINSKSIIRFIIDGDVCYIYLNSISCHKK
jgi:hypothetical protein